MTFKAQLLFLLGALVPYQVHSQLLNMDVVLRSGETVKAMDQKDFPVYRNGKCTVRYPRDGNWATQNGFNVGGWDANGKSQCQGDGPAATLTYALYPGGNFVAYCGYYLDYSTHSGGGGGPIDGKYFMAIDDDCILHIYRGTFDCNSVSIEKEIWSNVLYAPLQRGDRLRQGQYVRDEQAGTSLLMQSRDGNLILYRDSRPGRPAGEVLWAANREWGNISTRKFNEYYARISFTGHLTLVGIDFTPGPGESREQIYFDKDLHWDGASPCFTVEFDEMANKGAGDLVAVSCDDGDSKSLQYALRGSQGL